MFYVAVSLLGLFSWYKIPVELVPALHGEQLHVRFSRRAASPDTLERDILLPLEAKVGRIAGVVETWAEIDGSSGSLDIEFERNTDLRVRSLELQRIAAEINRIQPEGTIIQVSSQNLDALSRFVMSLQVTGKRDANGLREIVEERVRDSLSAIPGVSRVFVTGGSALELAVQVNTDRCAELNLSPSAIATALERSIQGLHFLGSIDEDGRQLRVVLDSRVSNLQALRNTPVDPARGVLLRHVATVELRNGPQEAIFRVNGNNSVGVLIFQEDGANLVALGSTLGEKIDQLNEELNPYDIELIESFDASRMVDDLLVRLKALALSGFVIALLILYLYLRQVRSVAVVAVAVPISLLSAGALLHLSGHSLNIITLFGLSIGVGMLVDNSIVVYEAVNRCLENGIDPQRAAVVGTRRTMRAIFAATATNAVVFLPLVYFVDDALLQQLTKIIAAAILLPLIASLLVASTLVPLMAQRLAKPMHLPPEGKSGKPGRPVGNANIVDLVRELFAALLKVSLRNPTTLVVMLVGLLVLTFVIALPIVWVRSIAQPAPEASEVKVELALGGGRTLDSASLVFQRLEEVALNQAGVEKVESNFLEDEGTFTVYLAQQESGPGVAHASQVRRAIYDAVGAMQNVQIRTEASERSSGVSLDFTTESVAEIAISGPDMLTLRNIAEAIAAELKGRPEIASVSISGRSGPLELVLEVDQASALFHRVRPEAILSTIHLAGREGEPLQAYFTTASGREVPITVRQTNSAGEIALDKLEHFRVQTDVGQVSLDDLTRRSRGLPPPTITHHNGRRELAVNYQFTDAAGISGADRLALEHRVDEIIRSVYKPPGYTVENLGVVNTTDKFKKVFVPALLLLFAVLAITFESVTLPLLVLVAVPMAVAGAIWGLFFGGFGLELMAGVGLIVLLGLAVNPAILLVDRIQQKMRSGHCSAGGAAMIAVRERARPVLITACTTFGGLWPMALVTGREMEIWPSFAAVVMGGVAISTFSTLAVIPVAYVFVNRFDRLVQALGASWVLLWLALTGGIAGWLIGNGYLVQFRWQFITTGLIAIVVFWIVAKLRPHQRHVVSQTDVSGEAMALEARYLGKTYDPLGPLARAWNQYKRFSRIAETGTAVSVERALIHLLLTAAAVYLSLQLNTLFWRVVFSYLAGLFLVSGLGALYEFFRAKGKRPMPALSMQAARYLFAPWLVFSCLLLSHWVLPAAANREPDISAAVFVMLFVLTVVSQFGRHSAIAIVEGRLERKVERGHLRRFRSVWRSFCVRILGFDIRQQGFTALSGIHFRADTGIVGILGPNGAGKTTFLRTVASVLEPSVGVLLFGGRDRRAWAGNLPSRIGYLPQEFGLYDHLTPAEYLEYFALLYRVGGKLERRERVEFLLKEVGLEKAQHERIGGFSGGMRQRVAVARTLLRLPSILIVDEPTVGLDPRERIRFRNLLAKLSQNRIVLFSTHVVEDVAVSSNRVIVLREGAIAYDGSPQQLAEVVAGKVWVLRTAESEIAGIGKHSKIVTQISEGGGVVRLRLLSESKPHDNAEPDTPTLEDGYLYLFGERMSG